MGKYVAQHSHLVPGLVGQPSQGRCSREASSLALALCPKDCQQRTGDLCRCQFCGPHVALADQVLNCLDRIVLQPSSMSIEQQNYQLDTFSVLSHTQY